MIQSVDTREIQLLDGEYVEKQRKISADATVSEILKLAMERETASYQFYSLLADRTKIEPVKNLFAFLAKQESDHRKYIETEYNRLNKK